MHDCIPWGLTGAFALGACTVLDRRPLTRWPEPLRAGVHFLDLGLDLPRAQRVADAASYASIPEKLDRWLRADRLTEEISANTSRYFDSYLEPARVGAQIFAALDERNRRPVASAH
jgi:hypothetical protein